MTFAYAIIKDCKTNEDRRHALLSDPQAGPWILRKATTFEVNIRKLSDTIIKNLIEKKSDWEW